jgi:Bacteriophage HK97-gp10, putative tail-component
MPPSFKYVPDRAGVDRFLRSVQMQEALLKVAELVKDEAVRRAPVGNETGKDKEPGRYRDSFHTAVAERGGTKGDRAEASVYNDAPEASFVEFGRHGHEPYHTLLRAAAEVRI